MRKFSDQLNGGGLQWWRSIFICWKYVRTPQNDIHFEDNMWNGMPKQNDRIPGSEKSWRIIGEAYFLEHGWDVVRIVRPSNVYGPHDDFNPKTAQVIPSLINRILNGENPLVVWGDGEAERDFIFSEDAFWMLEALKSSPAILPINLVLV